MSEYILILIWIGLCAFLAKYVQVKKPELVCGVEEERYYWLFAFIVFLPVILMTGFRDRWFTDTVFYVADYLEMPNDISSIPSYLNRVSKDKGFAVLSIILKSLLGDNFSLYLLTIAFLQGLIVLSFFRKYSTKYILSVFLFVASVDYLSWMSNGTRQFLAVTIILAATPLMLRDSKDGLLKKYVPLFAVIVFASFFHQSALLMIPFVVIAQGKTWNKKTLLFILTILTAILFVGRFTSILDSALADTQYKNVVSEYTQSGDDGTNPIRVLVYAIPTVFAFLARQKIKESNNKLINLCVNMSILSTGLYVISIFTSGIFMGRLPIYCSLYGYILLPWEIEEIFETETRKFVYPLMVVLYFCFYFYQLHIAWELI